MSTGERAGDPRNEDGRVPPIRYGPPYSAPSLIRQDIPRRRPQTSINAARVQASSGPSNPRHKPLRIIRRPVNGARIPRFPPLTPERLWRTADRPTVVRALHTDDLCSICVSVKSHPVWAACGHGYCYVCIRTSLETTWECPTRGCEHTIYRPPVRKSEEEEKLAALYPTREDKSVVDYSWSGLLFPRLPSSP
ncbi:hypothetical protein C8R47DRAFT_1208545 [Mycena vitilis]|nr:hypothetical protein C8R47DRAFT_1208545 [Mycena vitilis]